MTDTGQDEIKNKTETEQELEDQDMVNFSDRVIAFLILVLPFSVFVDRVQALLLDYVSQYVNNMIVLAALIGFLVLVGWLSKKVHAFRNKRSGPVG